MNSKVISIVNRWSNGKKKATNLQEFKGGILFDLGMVLRSMTEDERNETLKGFEVTEIKELLQEALNNMQFLPEREEKVEKQYESKASGRTFLRALVSVLHGNSAEKQKKFEEEFSIMNGTRESISFEEAVKLCFTEKVVILKGNRALCVTKDSVVFMTNGESEVSKKVFTPCDAINVVGAKKILGWLYKG